MGRVSRQFSISILLNAEGKFIKVSFFIILKMRNSFSCKNYSLNNQLLSLFMHHARCMPSNVTETGLSPCPAQPSALGSSKMAVQVRVLQLDVEQELETKLYRLEKAKYFLLEEPKVLL